MRGAVRESQATSPHARWTDGSKAAAEGTLISPARGKPKKQVTAAAHSIIVSKFDADEAHWDPIWRRMSGVIGNRGRLGRDEWDESWWGYGRHLVICACLTAARYVFMVEGASPWLANVATK